MQHVAALDETKKGSKKRQTLQKLNLVPTCDFPNAMHIGSQVAEVGQHAILWIASSVIKEVVCYLPIL
jgi:hypothetical protein